MSKTIFITGATGLIGSALVKYFSDKMHVVACARNHEKASQMFDDNVEIFVADINNKINYPKNINYIIHCASNTSSKSFVEQPVETLQTTIIGTDNVLQLANEKNIESMVYLSSMEVYGTTAKEKLTENDYGYIDILNSRSSYPMGKRAAETLCFSYFKEKNIPVKIARLAQTFGGSVEYNDTRVFAQFARSIVEKRDIVLNTDGSTIRSYCHLSDAVDGISTILLKGKNGEAYNISKTATSIKEIAEMLVEKYPTSNLKFDIKDTNVFYPSTKWNLDTTKLKNLGWEAKVNLNDMFENLIENFNKQRNS